MAALRMLVLPDNDLLAAVLGASPRDGFDDTIAP